MILLDTNILIELYRNNPDVIEALRQIGVSDLAVSIVTVAELYFGARDKGELARIKAHLALLHQIPLDPLISQEALGLLEQYVLSHRLNLPDALIAATARRNALALYTLNIKDFRYIPGLQLYSPASYP